MPPGNSDERTGRVPAKWLVGAGVFVLLYFVMSKGLGDALAGIGHGMRPNGAAVPLAMVLPRYVGLAVAVIAATALAARWDGGRLGAYGLADRRSLSRFAWGCLMGLGSICGFVLFLRSQHLLVVTAPDGIDARVVALGLGWAFLFFLVALVEEMLFRGYLLFGAARRIGWWPSALLLAAAFVLYHWWNEGENALGLANIALVGLVDALSIYYTRSLWWVLGYHAAWDWGESFLWGAADSGKMVEGYLFHVSPAGSPLLSGGTAGPEGSVYNVAVLLAAALGMVLWWGSGSRRAVGDPARPQVS